MHSIINTNTNKSQCFPIALTIFFHRRQVKSPFFMKVKWKRLHSVKTPGFLFFKALDFNRMRHPHVPRFFQCQKYWVIIHKGNLLTTHNKDIDKLGRLPILGLDSSVDRARYFNREVRGSRSAPVVILYCSGKDL